MEWLTDWFTSVWESFERWGKSLVLTVFDVFKDVLYFVLETILEIVQLILNGLGSMFDAMNFAQYISAIPPDVANVMGLIGLGQAVTMIVGAIGIRVVLQLIPFTRLGS
jgi:hypothetical protein